MINSYSRGILLWIDDHDWESLTSSSGDVEVWHKIFGNTESSVYRLLGLQLEIAMTFEAARKAIERYQNPEYSSTYVTAVVDLSIPREKGGWPDIKFGLKIAKVLQNLGIPFVFLSNSSSAQDKLRQEGLESVPYYQKQPGVDAIFMPEELVRSTLTDFKNHISWINLRSLASSITKHDGFSLFEESNTKLANESFPFFGAFRDFVERWENRPFPRGKDITFVLRAPTDHSDKFTQQCVLLVLSQHLHARRSANVRYISDNAIAHYLDHSTIGNKGLAVFRLNPELNSAKQLEELIRIRRESISIYIIPNDESADVFLEIFPRRKNVVYDDLPLIRLGDSASREELIRKVSGYVFQEARITIDDEVASLSPLYITFPELLINPLNWVALMENENVDPSLSDPNEVFGYLVKAVHELEDLDALSKQNLILGHPVKCDDLLTVASEIVDKATELHFRWWQRMLDSWLRTSWYFPYGLADKIKTSELELDPVVWKEWEDFCLEIIVNVISDEKYLSTNEPNVLPQVKEAVSFFENTAITKLLNDESSVDVKDWESLASKRWPHLSYPLPTSLGRRLKAAGRYSWIQNDHMDLTMAFPVGQRESRHLNYLTVEFGERISWLSEVSGSLPLGWQESIDHLVSMVKNKNVRTEWEMNPDKVWDSFLTILRNATPISLVFHFAMANKPLAGKVKATGNKKNSAEFELSNTHGYGKLLEMIRGKRELSRSVLQYEGKLLDTLSESMNHFVSYGLLGRRYVEHIEETTSHRLGEIPLMISEVFPKGLRESQSVESLGEEVYNNLQKTINKSMYGKQNNWFSSFSHDNKSDECERGQGLEDIGLGNFTSLLATKADYMFHALDMLNEVRFISMGLRHYDGYLLLAVLGDIRNKNKDSRPQVSVKVIEELLELFIWSIEGLIAQLKVCLDLSGNKAASEKIALNNIKVELPVDFVKPELDEVAAVLKVIGADESRLEVFGLGIPGENTVNTHCYHVNNSTRRYAGDDESLLLPQKV